MTVQELINKLMYVEDTTKEVVIRIESGRSCYSVCDDVVTDEDVDKEGNPIFIIGGVDIGGVDTNSSI